MKPKDQKRNLDVVWMETIEADALSTSLDDLTRDDLAVLGRLFPSVVEESDSGLFSPRAYRIQRRHKLPEEYADDVRALFTFSNKHLDWAKYSRRDSVAANDGPRVERSPSSVQDDFEVSYLACVLMMFRLMRRKNADYKDSWRRRGDVGVFHNLARKWDRLEAMIHRSSEGYDLNPDKLPEPGTEGSIEEQLGDLANYSIMWMSAMPVFGMRRSSLEQWADRNGLDLEGAKTIARELLDRGRV